MYIVVGGTGHVGSAVATALIEQGKSVTIVARDATKASAWRSRGAKVAEANVRDVDALRTIFRTGKRAFLLNPSADPKTDTDVEERKTVRSLLSALEGSGLEKVVAASTYGAQPGERVGDLSVLYELEQGLRAQPIPAAIVRGAYYFSNWDGLVEPAKKEGVLPTVLPAQLQLPMVAPADIGRVAASLLTGPLDDVGLHYVEGPQRYTAGDVADAFAAALGRKVQLAVAPREKWEETFKEIGFSEAAARSYARMTAVTVDGCELPESPIRGSLRLQDYVARLVRTEATSQASTT